MRLGFLGLFVVMVRSVNCATEICGEVTAPMELHRSQSPIILTQDLYIPRGSRLTIEAGTTILVSPRPHCKNGDVPQWDWSDSQHVSIKVDGALYISGTPEAPVVIAPEHPEGSKVIWDGIRLRSRSSKVVQIEYLRISGADRAIRATTSSFGVSNSLFENNNVGIELRSAADLNIFNNVFSKNIGAGIDQKGTCPNIHANIFWRNGDGIRSDSRRSPRIENNLFWQNGTDCYHCEVGTGRILQLHKDKFENVFADPIWLGSASEAQMAHLDPQNPTDESETGDAVLAQKEGRARNLNQIGIARQSHFQPKGNGPYRLSRYSPALGAGPRNFFFNNADGSRGDIGMWGGTPERTGQDYPW